MKAAKGPPSADVVGEASVLIDRLVLETDGTADPTKRSEELRGIHARVTAEAIGQYLRLFPHARSSGGTHVQIVGEDENDFVCLFCRASVATVGKGGRTLVQAFWNKLRMHTDLCAARFLAGQIEPIGPNGESGARRVPVSRLTGRALIREAKAAAEYLGLPEPKARYSRDTRTRIANGKATALRDLVTEARRVADERAKSG